MRLDKTLDVILNSTVFSKMTVKRVADRLVQFDTQGESESRTFIIKVT
jgi:hypothetical protein